MTFNNQTDFDSAIAPIYRELFDKIQPSEQLLNATSRLYNNSTQPSVQTRLPNYFRPVAATLCAACLLLTLGIALWPQPENLTPNGDAQLSVASNLDNSAPAAPGPESAPRNRMAATPTAQGIDALNMPPEYAADTVPELCALPLAKQSDFARKPFVKPTDAAILGHCPAASAIYWLMPNWAARTINWLTLW